MHLKHVWTMLRKKHIKIFLFLWEYKHDGDLKAPANNIQYKKSYLFDPLNVTKWNRIPINKELTLLNTVISGQGKKSCFLQLYGGSKQGRRAGCSASRTWLTLF